MTVSRLPPVQFTHAGVFVTDLDRAERFYTDVLGFIASDRGVASTGHRLVFLTQDPQMHHQLVIFSGNPGNLPFNTVNQLSFPLKSLEDLRTCFQFLTQGGHGPLDQVDHGNAWSVYFRDPDANPVELYVDTPFYTPQPCKEPLDLKQSPAEILERTERMCRARKGFLTRDDWMETIRRRLLAERR